MFRFWLLVISCFKIIPVRLFIRNTVRKIHAPFLIGIAKTKFWIEKIVIVFYYQARVVFEPVDIIFHVPVLQVNIGVPVLLKFPKQFGIAVKIIFKSVMII